MRPLESLYEQTRGRIVEVITGANRDVEDAGSTKVPACPSWSVHDVIAHVTGNCADVLAGNVAGAGTDEWTAAQVESRRDRSLAEILAEWDSLGPQMAALVDDFPGRYGVQVNGDLAIHEQDIRGALGEPGARDSDAVALSIEFVVSTFMQPGAAALGLAPLEVGVGDRRWLIGSDGPATGDPEEAVAATILSGEAPPAPTAPAAGALEAEPFDLFRALTGRRSTTQIRGFDWTVDPEPYLPLFALGPFSVRPTDLLE